MPVENPVPFSRAMLEADQEAVLHACTGVWLRETAIRDATHLGIGRVRQALRLAAIAGRLEERPIWIASGNCPVRSWRTKCPTNP